VIEWWKRVQQQPVVAHLLRAVERFNGRLGNQFGAALTYFSVLAVVPLIMIGFGVLGFVLELRPDLLAMVKDQATEMLGGLFGNADPDGNISKRVSDLIDNAFSQRQAIAGVGGLGALYAGTGWVGNLKSAVRAQWRPRFDLGEQKRNFVVELLLNVAILVGLLVLILITFGLAGAATSLQHVIVAALHAEGTALATVLQIAPILLSIVAGWVLFMYLYWVFPRERVPLRSRILGSLIAAIGLGVLQYVATILFGVFSNNPAVALFGPVLTLMLFFNLFARLILFVAAWIATSDQPATPEDERVVHDPYAPVQGPPSPRPRAGTRPRGTAKAAAIPAAGEVEWRPGEGQEFVPQKVAVRGVRVGLGAGWLTGVAAGTGIGAVIAAVAARLGRRRR